jgi:hypothetical protein
MPKIQIVIGKSKALQIYFILIFGMTLFLASWLCLQTKWQILFIFPLCLMLSVYVKQQIALQASRTHARAIVRLRYFQDTQNWQLQERSGKFYEAVFYRPPMLTKNFIMLYFKKENQGKQSVLIWQDALSAEAYRAGRFFLKNL